MSDKISFKPNTITYSADKNSPEGKKIDKSRIGLYTHTQYHGKTLHDMKAGFSPDMSKFKEHEDVYHRHPGHDTSKVAYSHGEQKTFQHHMDAAKKIHDVHGDKMYKATEKHQGEAGHLKTYINHTVRADETPSPEGLKKHIETKAQKEIDKVKTPAAKEKKTSERNEHTNHIENNKEHYKNLLDMHHHLQKAKDTLVHVLSKDTGGLEHHIGSEKAKPEGFVVAHKGTPTKLVDRKEFSKANFLPRS